MAEANIIKIRGARVHNLKNIDVDIPRGKLVVITGISGSGKSSLAFDTLYAEAERRFVESLSAYARQFLGLSDKPDVEKIEGLPPAISIDQKSVSKNPRSTVGTITEIYDYLRLLFARIGTPHCPECGRPVRKQSATQMTDEILKLSKGTDVVILGPLVRDRKGEHKGILQEVEHAGFLRVRFDGVIHKVEEAQKLTVDKMKKHNVEVVVDRFTIEKDLERARVADSVETALKMGDGITIVNTKGGDTIFSERYACPHCHMSLPDIEPRTFSFNSPHGACPDCTGIGSKTEVASELVIPNPRLTLEQGAIKPWMSASHRVGRQGWFWWMLEELALRHGFSLSTPVKDLPKRVVDLVLYGDGKFEGVIGNLERKWRETDSDFVRKEIEQYMVVKTCETCQGKRLRPEALAVKIAGVSIDRIVEMSIEEAKKFFEKFASSLTSTQQKIAGPILKEVSRRLQFLLDVGLDYLTLHRESTTLAGGEAQRIRLATQIGSGLVGVLYILDEPSIGLHARDQGRLIRTLKDLRDLGNTVLVVEHDPQTIHAADWVIDVGPGAGEHGGKVVFTGTSKQLLKAPTLTGEYLSGRKRVEVMGNSSSRHSDSLIIHGAAEHNLKNIDVKIPLGKFVCITGVSGSGKSTLMNDILATALLKQFYRAKEIPGKHKKIEGAEHLDKVVIVDQSPIGRTPRSNPATYTGAFTPIRDVFAKTHLARMRGYSAGRFSFNVKGGRCEVCEGQGVKKIEMYFLPDVYVECEECHGTRYNKEALEIEYRGKNIAQVLEMSIAEALTFFEAIPAIKDKLQTLEDIGLGYMRLGQPAPELSGGEAQRVKLATELSKRATGRTLYILDEPTTGLHYDDVKKLLLVLRSLVDRGNSVLVIEHNLDVVKNADWIIDLGPEGGEKGGEVIAEGTPEGVAKLKSSFTGQYLKKVLAGELL
ncbi:excinuclease ABC subunit UvrA [Candidatus Azambacteria bacterium]|nr:excinuclease ABC subunit UvrA [Candidatus Azambacteria bacterium]